MVLKDAAVKSHTVVESITDFTKNFFASFVVGTLVFTIISDGVSALFWEVLGKRLETEFGISYNWLRLVTVLLLIGLLLGLTYFTSFARWLQQYVPFFTPPYQPNVQPLTEPYPGLIVAMSPKNDSPAEAVIRFHWNDGQGNHLKHCWIICTDKSLPYATEMMQRFDGGRAYSRCEVSLWCLRSA
ncbi:crispr-associated protein [Leptolyngbya sp. Heron Island J]|nr:crispr-associated protein [Leptolyngbya sp. Heron Island J]